MFCYYNNPVFNFVHFISLVLKWCTYFISIVLTWCTYFIIYLYYLSRTIYSVFVLLFYGFYHEHYPLSLRIFVCLFGIAPCYYVK